MYARCRVGVRAIRGSDSRRYHSSVQLCWSAQVALQPGVHRVSGRGRLLTTGETRPFCFDCREAVLWDGAPAGIAETTYPHPQAWHVRGTAPDRTLERLSIKELTAAFRAQFAEPPTCESTWSHALGVVIPWESVWRRLRHPMLTPRDTKNYFRFLHRSMLTRNILPREGDDPTACRMCALEREHFSHIYECSQMVQVFRHFAKFAKEYVATYQQLRLTRS